MLNNLWFAETLNGNILSGESEWEILYCPANGEMYLPQQPKDSTITKNNNNSKKINNIIKRYEIEKTRIYI